MLHKLHGGTVSAPTSPESPGSKGSCACVHCNSWWHSTQSSPLSSWGASSNEGQSSFSIAFNGNWASPSHMYEVTHMCTCLQEWGAGVACKSARPLQPVWYDHVYFSLHTNNPVHGSRCPWQYLMPQSLTFETLLVTDLTNND